LTWIKARHPASRRAQHRRVPLTAINAPFFERTKVADIAWEFPMSEGDIIHVKESLYLVLIAYLVLLGAVGIVYAWWRKPKDRPQSEL